MKKFLFSLFVLGLTFSASAQVKINKTMQGVKFSSVQATLCSASVSVTVTNTSSTASVTIQAVTVDNPALAFTSLPVLPLTVAPSGTTTIGLKFCPQTQGWNYSQLAFATSRGNTSFTLVGLGLPSPPPPAPDTTPPSVSITSPTEGQSLAPGVISATASATDNIGVVGVQFILDGADFGAEDTTSPYAVAIDLTALSLSNHTVSARARDTAKNVATSATVNFSITPGPGGQVSFTPVIVANNFGEAKTVGDIEGDGKPDIVLASDAAPFELVWYRWPDWTKSGVIGIGTGDFGTNFSGDLQLADIDGDGDQDIVAGLGTGANNAVWYENPRLAGDPLTAPWTKHVIASFGSFPHDIQVGDFNKDGRVDIAMRSASNGVHRLKLYIQQGTGWVTVDLSAKVPAPVGEGLALTDLDGDTLLDVVVDGAWLQAPADPINGVWTYHNIDRANFSGEIGVAAGDLNGDGRLDVAFSVADSAAPIVWFEAPPDPRTGTWTQHTALATASWVHQIKIADINGDGFPDIVFGETAPDSATRRVGVLYGNGFGTSWSLQVLSTTGAHNVKVADFGSDGDTDIVAINYASGSITLWVNQRIP